MAKHMIVSHLDSSNSERCAVKFSKMFLARYKGKNLILKIKLLWIGNESLQGLAEKQVVNNDKNQLVDLYSSMLLTNRDIMSNASRRCSNGMKIHKCSSIEESEERPSEYLP